nr:MAG TPA: hypothetical protein [Caudoviricetes sp.]
MLFRLIAEEQFLSSAKPHNVLQLCVRITTNSTHRQERWVSNEL